MTRVILQGCCGKMGRMVTGCAALFPEIEIVAGIDQFVSDPPLPYPVYSQADEVLEKADVIIDFSRPEGLVSLLSAACNRALPVVLATTGLSAEENHLVDQAAEHIAIFQAANYSVGIKAMQKLLQQAVDILGNDCDIEIVETHHNQKVDAPSGTALALADSIRQAFGEDRPYVFGRQGRACKRQPKDIGIHALRGGTVTGEHEVFFFGQDEVISIKHHAASRQVFAMGALKAARFLHGQAPGRYTMDDLLNDTSAKAEFSTDRAMIQLPAADCAAVSKKLTTLGIVPLYQNLSADHWICIVTAVDAGKLPSFSCMKVCECVVSGKYDADLPLQILSVCRPLCMTAREGRLHLWVPLSVEDEIREVLDKVL